MTLSRQHVEVHARRSWPPVVSSVVGPWLCGFSGGYSNRANSAYLPPGQPLPTLEEYGRVRQVYESAGMPCLVHVRNREVVSTADIAEAAWGSVAVANPTLVMVCEQPPTLTSSRQGQVVIRQVSRADFLEAHAKLEPEGHRWFTAIINGVTLTSTYLRADDEDGQPAAVLRFTTGGGMCGLHSLFVRDDLRRQGVGRCMVAASLRLAPRVSLYLHVDEDNAAARSLYGGFGFQSFDVYAYVTPAIASPTKGGESDG